VIDSGQAAGAGGWVAAGAAGSAWLETVRAVICVIAAVASAAGAWGELVGPGQEWRRRGAAKAA